MTMNFIVLIYRKNDFFYINESQCSANRASNLQYSTGIHLLIGKFASNSCHSIWTVLIDTSICMVYRNENLNICNWLLFIFNLYMHVNTCM